MLRKLGLTSCVSGIEFLKLYKKLGFPLPLILIVIFQLGYNEDVGNHAMKPINENKGN